MSEQFWNKRADMFSKSPSSTLSISAHDEAYKKYKDAFQKRAIFKNIRFEKSMSVLDLGCGVGRWSFQISPLVRKVCGVDISGKMIALANRFMQEKGARNVFFKKALVEKLPFGNGSFDIVLSVTVLQHVTPGLLPKAISEISRVCKKGGMACIIESTSPNSGASYLHPHSPDEWGKIFEKYGFRAVKVIPVSVMPINRIFTAVSSIKSKMISQSQASVSGKSSMAFGRILKSMFLAAIFPLDMVLGACFKNIGDQKVMIFRKV